MELVVENWTDHPQTLRILIHAQNGTPLYDETFHMDPQSRTGWFRPDIPQGVHRLTVVWRDTDFDVTRRFQDGEGGVAVAVFPDRLEIAGGGGIDRFDPRSAPTGEDAALGATRLPLQRQGRTRVRQHQLVAHLQPLVGLRP